MAGRNALFVEGTDDQHVLIHICKARGLTEPNVKPHKGVEALLEAMGNAIRTYTEEGDAVGVVMDANGAPTSRWQSVRAKLVQVGYEGIPESLAIDGMILDAPERKPLPRVGVWIMPNNVSSGKLEDLLQGMVPPGDTLFAHAVDVVGSLPKQHFTTPDRPKAVLHTWLAWQKEPGRPYGTAIEAEYLDAHAPAADGLVAWLNRLFNS